MDDRMERVDSPDPETLSADYYYLKALNYLSGSGQSSSEDGHCSCLHCPSSEEKFDDEHFSLDFRPGLTLDDLQGWNTSGGSTASSQLSTSPPTSSEHLGEGACGMNSKDITKNGSKDPSRKPRVIKRKLSDGHVHWADEFQKDLTRCNPRKSYSRHPSLAVPQVKPILKPNTEDSDQC